MIRMTVEILIICAARAVGNIWSMMEFARKSVRSRDACLIMMTVERIML
jgi:hypothetical protein